MKIALDTNILAYFEGVNSVESKLLAVDLIASLPSKSIFVPIQVLGELYNVLVRKGKLGSNEARDRITLWRDTATIVGTEIDTLMSAISLSVDHQLPIWDSVILATARDIGCRLLLSEDFQDGFTWGGVTVVNPFAPDPHWLLQSLLDTQTEEQKPDPRR